jgi:hypothetical protein
LGTDVNTTMPLLLNALALILCGASVIGAPLAILGLVWAIQAKNAKGIGDVATARSKAKQSMYFFAGTVLLGPILFLTIWQFLTPASAPPR